MNLTMASEAAEAYKSGSQRALNVTEPWGAKNLFCPNCPSPKLERLKPNTKAADYKCPNCGFWYQLKGKKTPLGNSISDGAYASMMEAVRNDRTPNFFFMHYQLPHWTVKSLLLVPHFAFPTSAIIKRNPLSPTARRAGHVLCNIALSQIPTEARINIVSAGKIMTAAEVRKNYRRIKPLGELTVAERGWALDVLTAVRSLSKLEFSNQDLYALAPHFEKLHPDNRHIRDKLRQQLQNLRDLGLLEHVSKGHWRRVS
jgi:type II restriction enzyme